jgi:alanine racemase
MFKSNRYFQSTVFCKFFKSLNHNQRLNVQSKPFNRYFADQAPVPLLIHSNESNTIGFGRPSKAIIDLDALRHNYQVARETHGGKALAVIKANAYGHGAVECANALHDIADGYAVAIAAEAVELRANSKVGASRPILILEGCFTDQELISAIEHDLWIVVHQHSQIASLESLCTSISRGTSNIKFPTNNAHNSNKYKMHVWLKINTGMNRAGFRPDQMKHAYDRLKACNSIVGKITLMTHFARSDEPDQSFTSDQINRFQSTIMKHDELLQLEQSTCNSGGILAWRSAYRHWCRPGIMLYGANPLPLPPSAPLSSSLLSASVPGSNVGTNTNTNTNTKTITNAIITNQFGHPLIPVMTFQSQVFAVQLLQPGDRVGYGGGFVAPCRMLIGLVAAGYADGYPRCAPAGTWHTWITSRINFSLFLLLCNYH